MTADQATGHDILGDYELKRSVIDLSDAEISIQGVHRSGMSAQEARDYLSRHTEGLLVHDAYDDASFVAMDSAGVWLFYNGVDDTIGHWRWDLLPGEPGVDDAVPASGWCYLPATEMALTAGGLDWWRDIRDGQFTPKALLA